ncbi:reverse transcriptase domain-containing protein [Tanacetum coccineum]
MKESTVRVLEGTARRYCSKIKVPLLFVKVPLVLSDISEQTASFVRYQASFWRFIEEVIMKKIEYCLFDVVVEFHSHGKTVITHSLTVGSSRNFERRKEGFWIRLCKGNNESRMVQTECMYDVRFTWMSRRSMLYVHQCIKGFKFVLPSFVNSYCRRRSKQDIINTVGTMGLKGLETSWNNSTAKVHEGTDEVLEGTAQEYESTAGANLSTAEVYESTAHSLFKISVEFHRCVFLSYLLAGGNLFVLKWCDEDLSKSSKGEPSSLFDFEEVMSIPHNNMGPPPARPPPPPNNGPPPVLRPNGQAPRSREEWCQPSIDGRGGPIAPIPIQATDFGLRHHMIQQVQNTCEFHGLPCDDANRHIDKFLEITQHMKQNGVSDDALLLSLFPYSLTHHAIAWYDRLPRNSIHSFDDMMRKFLSKYFPPSMVTKLGNEVTKFEQKPHESLFKDTSSTQDETSRNISSTTSTESPEVVRQLELMNKNFIEMMRQIQSVKSIDTKCETCGGPHSFTECPAANGYTQEAAYAIKRGDLKAITTRSGVSYDGPTIPPTSPLQKDVECETEATKDKKLSLPDVTPTRMTLKLADRSVAHPKGVAKDVFVKVGKLYFPVDFVVVDYDVDPRVPLIIGRYFLRTARALIDVHGEELTLRVNDEAITFKVGHTLRYSHNYYDVTVHQVNVIDVPCEEYAQEVLRFLDSSTSGSPTPSDPIIASSSPSFTL